jgi:hypothetical protein
MRGRHQFWLAAVHVAGLWAIAVVHPLLDVLGRSPEFFVAQRAEPIDILLLVGALLLAFPLVLAAFMAAAAAAGPRPRAAVTGTLLAALVGLLCVQLLKELGATRWQVAVPVAALTGIATAVLYFRAAALRSFFSLLSVGIAIVPTVFFLQPGIVRLVLPDSSGSSPADPAADRFLPAPVVLIVFDELPLVSLLDANRNIDPTLYPNLSALARDGVWFRNATTVSDYTRWALPPILTGRRPNPGDIPTAGDHPDTLFSFLSRTHRIEAFESVTTLCPRSVCADPVDTLPARAARIGGDLLIVAGHVFLTPDLHDRLQLPDLSANWAGFTLAADGDVDTSPRAWQRRAHLRFRDDRRELVAQFIDRIGAPGPQPVFYFLHTLLPHQPWVLLPSGQRNSSLGPLPSAMRVVARSDEWEIAQNQQRHLLQVGFVDRAVGQVMSRLKEADLYGRALVVITADHGVAITRGHPVRSFSPETAAEIMRVPLLVKPPATVTTSEWFPHVNADGQRVSDRNVESVDIAPTIAHVLGVPLPWKTDGSSLFDRSVPPREEKRIAFAGGKKTQRYGPEGPSFDAVLREKVATFGEANRYRVPRPPRYGELVGHAASDYRIVDSAETADMRFAWQYAAVDPVADAVPFDVSGRLNGRSTDSEPAYIAVSVNGVIQAVTRTWTSRPGGWLATPPLDAWRRGENTVELFVIAESGGQPVLGRVARPTARPEDLNLISGAAEHYWNVQQVGFHRHEGKGDRVFRWTRTKASLTVPLRGRTPAAVRVKIARPVEPEARLRITANGCAIYDGLVPRREWEATLPFGACDLTGDELTLGLTTTATRRRQGRDTRSLGMAVRSITLEMSRGSRAPR